MYCAVIGDIIQSKGISIEERNAIQMRLARLLEDVNKVFSARIAANFITTLGDEFQGLLNESACSMPIVNQIIREMHPYRLRFGIGVGDMWTTIDPQNAIGADGSAFHFAREAMTELKNAEPEIPASRASPLFSVRFETAAADGVLLNLACGFAQGIMSRWSDKQWDTIKAVIVSGNRQTDAADRLRLAKSTITRNLQAARYAEYRKIVAALEHYLKNTYDSAATASVRLQQAINLIDSARHFMRVGVDYGLALEKYIEALSIRRSFLDGKDERIAESLDYVAEACLKKGDGHAALGFAEEALSMREELVADDISLAKSYHLIGKAFQRVGQCQNAAKWHGKALAAREKALGAEHPDTAASYEGIADAYCGMGEHAKALGWHGKALAAREKALGAEHPDTASSYEGMAYAYGGLGGYAKALEWHGKALAAREKALGAEHPETAASCYGIACIYGDLGEYGKALDWHYKALAAREKALGAEHPDTGDSYKGIGDAYENLGEHGAAQEWHNKAQAIFP